MSSNKARKKAKVSKSTNGQDKMNKAEVDTSTMANSSKMSSKEKVNTSLNNLSMFILGLSLKDNQLVSHL